MEFFSEPQIVGIITGDSTAKAAIKDRASHALIFKESGESTYYLRQKPVTFASGTVLFIPEGETYHFKKSSSGKSIYHLINFHATIKGSTAPKLFYVQDRDKISSLFIKMEKKQLFSVESARRYELLSHFYQLLALLAGSENGSYLPKEKKELITPAIDYLSEHLFDTDIRITDLHTLCGISAPTFRRIFMASFGTSPRKYLINQRMKQAKLMLESGEFKSVAAVAAATGFDDPLYFSRLFSSHYHIPPSQVKK